MDKRILVLDDNQDILDVVTEALTYEGYTVRDISLGSQLFDTVRNFKPGLILLDHRLADASGAGLCHQLKSAAEYCHIPVLICSAYVNPGEKLPVNCDGYIYKPFDLDELFGVIRNFLPAAKEVAP